jgi:hypothetical protein
VCTPQLHARVGAALIVATLVLSGCASSSIQTDASAFVAEHEITAARAATATEIVEAQLSRLPASPSASQLRELAGAAAQAHRDAVRASDWSVASSGEGGEEGAEEEDLPRAETEATEAANDLAKAMSELLTYTRRPTAGTLARYESRFAHGREVWDESISQLWYLAHRSRPPTV